MEKLAVNDDMKRKLIKKIAMIAPDPKFIDYIYNMLPDDGQKEELLDYLDSNDELSQQQLNIKALDIKQRK